LYSIQSLADSGFVFAGYTRSYGGADKQGWIMRVDSLFNPLWMFPQFWHIGQGENIITHIALNDSAEYILCGLTSGAGEGGLDFVAGVFKEWYMSKYLTTFGSLGDESAHHMIQTLDKGYMILGITDEFGPANQNIYAVKTNEACQAGVNCQFTAGLLNDLAYREAGMAVYPNPSSGLLHIVLSGTAVQNGVRIRIVNALGMLACEMYAAQIGPGVPFPVDLSGNSPGLYFVEVLTGSGRQTEKILLH
jgi:hypothetical protein